MNTDEKIEFSICNPFKIDIFMETANYTSEMHGFLANFFNPYFDYIKSKNFSIKFIAYPGIGEEIDEFGHYSGCLGHLQSGEADIIIAEIDYPQPVENISQGYLLFDEKIGFSGSFPTPSVSKLTQVTSIFNTFSVKIWMVIFSTLVAFRFLVWLKVKVDKTRRRLFNSRSEPSFSQMVIHFAGYGSIEDNGAFMKIIFFTLTIFSFIIMAIFNGLVNTDNVVIKPPRLFESFDDLMENNIVPIFINQSYEMLYFKNSPVGSKQRNFWDWAVNQKFDEKAMIKNTETRAIFEGSKDVMQYKSILVTGENIINALSASGCDFAGRDLDKIKTMAKTIGMDASFATTAQYQIYARYEFEPKLKSLVLGKNAIENKKFAKILKDIYSKLMQHGHAVYGQNLVSNIKLVDLVMPINEVAGHITPNGRSIIEDCKSGVVNYPSHEVMSVKLAAFHKLFAICGMLILLATFIHIYEVYIGN